VGNPNQMRLELEPLQDGSYTRLSLLGPIRSAPARGALRQRLKMFSFWTGNPVCVALPVEPRTAGWGEIWTDALSGISKHHLEIVFKVKPAAKSAARGP
jgi:hypothetical protein